MSIYALVTGTVSTAPTKRTTAKGSPWVTLTVRAPSGEASAFVNVAVFDGELVPAALALAEGDAVTITGQLQLRTWQGRDGQERTGLSITATKIMPLTKPEPRPGRKTTAAPARPGEGEPFDQSAGDLDGVLPRGVTR